MNQNRPAEWGMECERRADDDCHATVANAAEYYCYYAYASLQPW